MQILELVMWMLHVRDILLAHFCALDLRIAPGLPGITIVWLRLVVPGLEQQVLCGSDLYYYTQSLMAQTCCSTLTQLI